MTPDAAAPALEVRDLTLSFGGEVTATMKVRRSSVHRTYANEIEALYR